MQPPRQTRDDEAYELMRSAHALIPEGEFAAAAEALEKAAAIHREAGRQYDEARCLQLAATLRRAGGDTSGARELIQKAEAASPADLPLAVSIASERAQTAFDEGRFADSVEAWSRALASARSARATAPNLGALLRKRAAARIATGDLAGFTADYDEAASEAKTAGFVRVEQAEQLAQYGQAVEAARIIESLSEPRDAHLEAEALVLRARLLRQAGRLDEAMQYASRAREFALEAVAPLSYFKSAAELAEAYEAKSDRVSAYGVLATAWATLGDLLGQDVARSWVEPILIAYQFKWGPETFAAAKQAYEDRRRIERGGAR
jgi:tetratricopeptide (TPR) repeat protein